jgi:hypothetical protein
MNNLGRQRKNQLKAVDRLGILLETNENNSFVVVVHNDIQFTCLSLVTRGRVLDNAY